MQVSSTPQAKEFPGKQAGQYQPLPTTVAGEVVSVPERLWHRDFCCWFGDCDGNGWVSCCLVAWVPFVASGWNRQKVFGKGGALWGLAFFALGLIYFIAYQHSVRKRNCVTNVYTLEEQCDLVISPLAYAVMATTFLAGCALGFINRTQIRERLGIDEDGSKLADCLLWFFCRPCALCQETRTLMHNNVQNGIWLGPDVMVTIPVGTQLAYVQGQPLVAPTQQVHDPHPGDEKV